ncbi:polyadenylate-binding protein-interacting protein 2-like [Liolophura sinensis]|uniref:polyadenylate-binding protein-interacting protein 2-like n=1 Tax=Liolophura sinensis TaxID=3198878 RepID=UPI0031592834
MKCPVIHEEEPEPSQVRGRLPVNNDRVDFSDYEWMGEELEEFDRKVEEEFWEEEFIEACFEEMLEEEEAQRLLMEEEIHAYEELLKNIENRNISNFLDNVVNSSKLNPNAPEFIPRNQGNTNSS